tara:strand:- start:605 stop:1567 length:963 start_codon:yes stop_codon:yes gene_type:complete
MRQAGRYLPEYKATRKKAGSFLNLCYNIKLATEVTLQPIKRFDFDAAILFADILLLPQALGMDLWFEEGEGPKLNGLNSGYDINQLKEIDFIHEKLNTVYQIVTEIKSELPKEKVLIGFAGAPWTVATYMINGKGSKDHKESKLYMIENKMTFDKLIEIITNATIEYLSKQIEAGAEVVKLFDSWAGSLNNQDFIDYCLEPAKKIAKSLKKRHPKIKFISFPRASGANYLHFSKYSFFDCIAVDNNLPRKWIRENLQKDICIQGNLDPFSLVYGGDYLKKECSEILNILNNNGFIFNLGHGITPDADPKNVELMIKYIRG